MRPTLTHLFSFLLLLFQSIGVQAANEALIETNFIVVDQFGYQPASQKIAFIRNPQTGYDANESYQPGTTFALVDAQTGDQVFTASLQAWNNGTEDQSSGDIVWRFDFSSYTEEGEYYIADIDNNVRSYLFEIRENIYKNVLIQAFKTFFYQRAGFAKDAPFAGTGWLDGASHLGPLQDAQCRRWGQAENASTEKDVHGGWYDAGDFNKYTNWTAEYVMYMLLMYEEKPDAWTDDFEIPESGNGIPDILDEAKFGLEHLLRLQFDDGSCVSVIGVGHASPPSSATGQSLWGDASTSATLSCAAAYAYGAKVFSALGDDVFANDLADAALNAWEWADANPEVLFYNNSDEYGTKGLAAGQQEVDEYGRLSRKLNAAMHLYEITGDEVYKTFFESNYSLLHLFLWDFAYPFESVEQEIVLYYTKIPGASPTVVSHILGTYSSAMKRETQLQALDDDIDAYRAYLKDYTWGSNNIRMRQGSMFYDFVTYQLMPEQHEQLMKAAENYIHYIHGANPLNKCYLSNMSAYGAENSVSEFYHTWFHDGSALWDNTITATYGPAPGFLVGGPNPSYDWDGCCPDGCGGAVNNARCYDLDISPPKNQPNQKSYKDFNNTWPLNSWSVTENSCGYQISYLRLLSKFVQSGKSEQVEQTIELKPGWNLISFYIEPAENSMRSLLPGEFSIKTLDGFYASNYGQMLNSLDTVAGGTGYLIKVGTSQTVTKKGAAVALKKLQLKKGWNLIGYPLGEERDIASVISSIAENIEVVKNFEDFFEPGGTVNNVSNFLPGKAYFIKVSTDCEFDWE